MKLLSAIVPCYNEEENVSYFYEECMIWISNYGILMTAPKTAPQMR